MFQTPPTPDILHPTPPHPSQFEMIVMKQTAMRCCLCSGQRGLATQLPTPTPRLGVLESGRIIGCRDMSTLGTEARAGSRKTVLLRSEF